MYLFPFFTIFISRSSNVELGQRRIKFQVVDAYLELHLELELQWLQAQYNLMAVHMIIIYLYKYILQVMMSFRVGT